MQNIRILSIAMFAVVISTGTYGQKPEDGTAAQTRRELRSIQQLGRLIHQHRDKLSFKWPAEIGRGSSPAASILSLLGEYVPKNSKDAEGYIARVETRHVKQAFNVVRGTVAPPEPEPEAVVPEPESRPEPVPEIDHWAIARAKLDTRAKGYLGPDDDLRAMMRDGSYVGAGDTISVEYKDKTYTWSVIDVSRQGLKLERRDAM